MSIEQLLSNDLEEIRKLQPEGWPDIIPEFEFYINSSYCYPIKKLNNNKIIGVGTSIVFDQTSWLAHIIVDKEYRNRGIGYQLTEELLNYLREKSINTCLLIATELGLPIYKKVGFKVVTAYKFLKRQNPWDNLPISKNIQPYKRAYFKKVNDLDKIVSGENRELLLKYFLVNSMIYIEANEVKAYYIPDLGEGLIIADNDVAGLELMKVKYSHCDKAVLPSDNLVAIEFLMKNGFVETDTKGTRMIFGNEINWEPKKIFSRIGGNFG